MVTKNQNEKKNSKLKSSFASFGKAINHDFCPNLNQYVYWIKKPVGWVISCALVSAMIGFFVGPQGFILMWTFCALLGLGCIWPWLGVKGVSARLHFDRSRSKEGESTTAILKVRNRWPIPVFGLSIEGAFLQDADFDEEKVEVGLRRLAPLSDSEFRWETVPQQRGILPNSEPEIVTGFPFGLYRAARKVKLEKQTVVWPKSTHLAGNLFGNGSRFDVRGSLTDRSGMDGDVIGVRDFRRGDLLRDIHWAQTARCNQLVVRERQSSCQSPALVLVDLTPESHAGIGSQSSYEWAIRIAASVCQQLHDLQTYFEMHCIGVNSESRFPRSNRGIGEVFDYLARLPRLSGKVNVESFEEFELDSYLSSQSIRYDKVVLIRTSFREQHATTRSQLVQVVLSRPAFKDDSDYSTYTESFTEFLNQETTIRIERGDDVFAELKKQWEGVREYELRS